METKNNWKAWLYLAPIIILMAVFTFYPIINTIGISFLKNYNSVLKTSEGFTFDNYLEILMIKPTGELWGEPVFQKEYLTVALPNTLILTFITVPLSILIALAIAIALNSIKPLKKILQTIFFMPYVTNAIAIGMVFSVIFDTNSGVFNFLFGLENHAWIFKGNAANPPTYWSALFALCFYIIWHSLPYKILIFLGGLQNIDQQYYDAAKIDGSSKFKVIRRITIPLLSPQILYVMITSFIGAFKEYTSIVGLFGDTGGSFQATGGMPTSMHTVVWYIYDMMSQSNKLQYAAAGAVILFIIILLFTGIQKVVAKKRVHY